VNILPIRGDQVRLLVDGKKPEVSGTVAVFEVVEVYPKNDLFVLKLQEIVRE